MKIRNIVQRGVLACCVALVSLDTAYCDEPSKTPRVEFVIGDYMPVEDGTWQASSSQVQEPFGIDFDERGAMYIVELTSGRLLTGDDG